MARISNFLYALKISLDFCPAYKKHNIRKSECSCFSKDRVLNSKTKPVDILHDSYLRFYHCFIKSITKKFRYLTNKPIKIDIIAI